MALAVGLLFLASGLAWRLLWGGQYGPGDGKGWSGPPFPLLILGLLGVAFVAGRAVRRMAAPIGEVMEAADQVAGRLLDPGAGPGPGEVGRLALLQPDDRAPPGQRDPAPRPAGRRRPRAADAAVGDPGNVEGMLDGVYPADDRHLAPLLEETVMARLLDDLQTLSTAEAEVLRLTASASTRSPSPRTRRPRSGPGRTGPGSGSPAARPRLVPEVDVDPVRIGESWPTSSATPSGTPRGRSVEVVVGPDPAGVAVAWPTPGPGSTPRPPARVRPVREVRPTSGAGPGWPSPGASSRRTAARSGPQHARQGTVMRFVLPAVENSTGSSG